MIERFHVELYQGVFAPSYNIAPAEPIATITQHNGSRRIDECYWGYNLRHEVKEPHVGLAFNTSKKSLNVTAKKLASSYQRCLIPADGFYAWKKEGTKNIPYYFHINENNLFAFAGICIKNIERQGVVPYACSVLTVGANELVSMVQNTMPAIVARKDEDAWLNMNDRDLNKIEQLLQPFPSYLMNSYPVSNNIRYKYFDGKDAIKPTSDIF